MEKLSPPPVIELTDVTWLTNVVMELKEQLEKTNARLVVVEGENHCMKKLAKETKERVKFIGRYEQKIEYIELQIALGHDKDLSGFKYLVGSVFNPNFDQDKIDKKLNYDQFPEEESLKLSELIGYFCHCKLVVEDNPHLRHGTFFPDYPIDAMEHDQSNEDSFNPVTESSLLKSKNSYNAVKTRGRGENKKVLTKQALRVLEVKKAYAKSFTNRYQEDKKSAEKVTERNEKAKLNRAKKKQEKVQLKAKKNDENVDSQNVEHE